jgi:AcrR family transcriptional regulator
MGITERKARAFRRREQRILDAALTLFNGDDWQAVTIEQIADKAEIGKGTIYKHFAGKDEIYARLSARFQAHALERLGAIDPALPVIQRLRAAITVLWEHHRGAEQYQRLVQYCERHDFRRNLAPGAQAELEDLDARIEGHVHGLLREGMAQGILPRKPVESLLFGPLAALQGAVRLIRSGHPGAGRRAAWQLEELTNFILAGMLYQEWLADEGLDDEETVRRAANELSEAETELAAEASRRGRRPAENE